MSKKYKVLICSDDYNDFLISENYYEGQMNSCFEDYFFDITIVNNIDFKLFNDYDFIVFDYGLIGNLDYQKLKNLFKLKNVFVTSAMPESFIRAENCYLPYLSFQFDIMGVELRSYLEKKTMNDEYGDGSNHIICPVCGECITCGDCKCEKGDLI